MLPEIVTPLRNTVRLVDNKMREFIKFDKSFQEGTEGVGGTLLRSYI